ncbi:MAG: MMPL family transporter [Microthrixaceae bacterium]
MARLAAWCFGRKWIVVALWVGAAVGVFSTLGGIGGARYESQFQLPSSDSRSGLDVMQNEFAKLGGGGFGGSIVFTTPRGVADPAVRSAMTAYFDKVAAMPRVRVTSPYEGAAGASQISKDGRTAYATIELEGTIDRTETGELGQRIIDAKPRVADTQIEVGGQVLSTFKPPSSEMIGIAFAIVVLIVAFGSVLAMGMPIAVALAGVGLGTGAIGLLSHSQSIPDMATTIGAMIGLGVGIDYALFIVTRYREGLHQGLDPEDATVTALDTAGRAVIFAGLTVVISMLGMLIMNLKFISGLGIAAAVTVLVTMIASITLLPAILGFAKDRVEVTRWRGLIAAGLMAVALLGVGLKLPAMAMVAAPLALVVLVAGFALAPLKAKVPQRAVKPKESTLAYRWSHAIQRRPWTAVVAGIVLLGLLAVPLLSLRLGSADEGNFPRSTTTRKAYDLTSAAFGPGFNGPLLLTVTGGGSSVVPKVIDLSKALGGLRGVDRVVGPIPNTIDPAKPIDQQAVVAAMGTADAFLFRVIPTTSPQDVRTQQLIDRLRDTDLPRLTEGTGLKVHVTGAVAITHDFATYLGERVPAFLAVVLALSFLLLMVVFRSLLVPLKAVLMNLLSIGAAYGVIVAVFQWGWAGNLLRIDGGPIEPFLPMMMFAIVFGLSMDYEVFLLSRVKEEFDHTGDPRGSVADGLAATAQVITAAAAIMVVVFGSFMFDDLRVTKMFGLGLAVAVFLDATLVRMLLVPATMELLGAKNWWFPGWLDRLIPTIDVEGHEHHEHSDGISPAAGGEDEHAASEDGPTPVATGTHSG